MRSAGHAQAVGVWSVSFVVAAMCTYLSSESQSWPYKHCSPPVPPSQGITHGPLSALLTLTARGDGARCLCNACSEIIVRRLRRQVFVVVVVDLINVGFTEVRQVLIRVLIINQFSPYQSGTMGVNI